ncbi:hypothetical protein BO83DRAFT_410732 [Aspergillus eucalypticola CBS 122712]|uniref:Uncharacterized protein n=1 Tax=Aspergillus eucalypticola (strain CBS 122712 / IBT 29274) TaxID=1448314 RepID=A0A317UXW2_ASPEC|nr:uncharacterized protein BO83DRAFT_410732 [Aspergillus eucalypticola CBS 122712]PWY65808.1 hypothetical protein BO83DRAFT_410732 [Aspergillus eucalypticola CBS 122712]
MSLSNRADLEETSPRPPQDVSSRLDGICEGPAALQSETSNSDKNGTHYPHVVGKGGTPDSVSVPELQSIRREPWNNFCRQYGNRPVGFCPWRRNRHTGRRTGLGS